MSYRDWVKRAVGLRQWLDKQHRELGHASASRRDSWTARSDSVAQVADITGWMKA
jgi:hypothetical protein